MSNKKISFYSAFTELGKDQAIATAKGHAISKGFTWNAASETVFIAGGNENIAPSFRGKITSNQQAIEKWVLSYFNDYNNRPSERTSNPPATKPDPVLDLIIKARLDHLTDGDIEKIMWAHRLGMSSENIFGTILEEYLADRLEPHGWYCAWGAVLKAVDFVNGNGDCLQIKSRNNTENSSSNKIRSGTDIKKWWRFHATKGTTNWDALNTMLGIGIFSEPDFQEFVEELIENNPLAMAVENDNVWKTP